MKDFEINSNTDFHEETLYLYSVCVAKFISQSDCHQQRTFSITKQEWREIWRLIYKAMTRKGL